VALALALAFPAAALRSPWDGRAPAPSAAPYRCPEAPRLPRDTSAAPFYSDAKRSVADPERLAAWRAARGPYAAALREVEAAADAYQATGSAAAARCALGSLATLAGDGALTGAASSEQAEYLRGWTAGALALAYLKVRPSGLAAPAQASAVRAWLGALGRMVRHRVEARRAEGALDARNNHLYWDGLTVAAAGVAADRAADLDFGADVVREAARAVGADGTLPLEVGRGRRALHYHLFAAAPLVTLAELSAANGADLYGEGGGGLHRLVRRVAGDLRGEGVIAARAGEAQDLRGPADAHAVELAWTRPYLRRFPDPALSVALRPAKAAPDLYLGGLGPP
jgi:poly(beta-D-mannuronate) lyase